MFEKLKFKFLNKAIVTEEKIRVHLLPEFVRTGDLDEGEELELIITKSTKKRDEIGIAFLEGKDILEVLPADCDQIVAYKTSDNHILIAVQQKYLTKIYELLDHTALKEQMEEFGPIRFMKDDENRLFIGSHLFEIQRTSSGELVATDDVHKFTGNSAEILLKTNFGKMVE